MKDLRDLKQGGLVVPWPRGIQRFNDRVPGLGLGRESKTLDPKT